MATPHQPTVEEQARVLAAVHYLRARVGTWAATARALGVRPRTLRRVRAGQRIKRYLALRVATLSGAPVEDLLAGKFPPPGACPNCGHAVPNSR
jgi:hypothetical protein